MSLESDIACSPRLLDLLDEICDFQLADNAPSEWVRFSDGAVAYVLGKDASGGECLRRELSESAPIYYASSEGQAGMLAPNMIGFLSLLRSVPFWHDAIRIAASENHHDGDQAIEELWEELEEDIDGFNRKWRKLTSLLPAGELSNPIEALRACIACSSACTIVAVADGSPYERLL